MGGPSTLISYSSLSETGLISVPKILSRHRGLSLGCGTLATRGNSSAQGWGIPKHSEEVRALLNEGCGSSTSSQDRVRGNGRAEEGSGAERGRHGLWEVGPELLHPLGRQMQDTEEQSSQCAHEATPGRRRHLDDVSETMVETLPGFLNDILPEKNELSPDPLADP